MFTLLALAGAASLPSKEPSLALARRLGLRALRETEGGAPVIDIGTGTFEETKPEKPKMFRVMLYNSPEMDGAVVSLVIQRCFNKTPAQAWDLMLAAHRQTRAVLGVYTKEIAETRVVRAIDMAAAEMTARHGFSGDLSLSVESED